MRRDADNNVRAVRLDVEYDERRGLERYRPISSLDVLDNGQPYLFIDL